MSELPGFRQCLRADFSRWRNESVILDPSTMTWREVAVIAYRKRAARMMVTFRFGQWCDRRGIRLIPSMCQKRLAKRHGFEILIGGEIGPGLYVPHPAGTVLNPDSMGANCTVVHGATVGMRGPGRFPSFGDEVYIGAGARILGGITVGDRAKIGANAVVLDDVEADTSVGGVPARPIGRRRQEDEANQ